MLSSCVCCRREPTGDTAVIDSGIPLIHKPLADPYLGANHWNNMSHRKIDEQMVRRVCGEYHEMPGLRLTVLEASRLWQMAPELCEKVLSALVEQRMLVRTKAGAFVATPS